MRYPSFKDKNEYAQTFTSVEYWRPYVYHILGIHGMSTQGNIKGGLPGTHPVFIVDDCYVVKLFTCLFGSPEACEMEIATYKYLQDCQIPIATLLAAGNLYPNEKDSGNGDLWPWPYMVTTVLPGTSFGEAKPHSVEDKMYTARTSAQILKQMHSVSLNHQTPDWTSFRSLLKKRAGEMADIIRQTDLPPSLRTSILERLANFPSPFNEDGTPCLLHGDLNADHLLGVRDESGLWKCTGVIDFGDAKVGDAIYDLVPLHFGLFDCDKKLLVEFIREYGIATISNGSFRDFTTRVMLYTLLYEFDVLTPALERHAEWRQLNSLDELAAAIWQYEN